MKKEQIHTINEIEKKIRKERYEELLKLSETVTQIVAYNVTTSSIEKYRASVEAYDTLTDDLEKDLFASNIAFPDEEILSALVKSNNINIKDIILATSKMKSNEAKIDALRKIEKFRLKYYEETLFIDLLNKLNQIVIFKPSLLTNEEELDKLIGIHK